VVVSTAAPAAKPAGAVAVQFASKLGRSYVREVLCYMSTRRRPPHRRQTDSIVHLLKLQTSTRLRKAKISGECFESNFVRHAALFVLLLLLDDTSAQLCSGYKGEDDGKLQSNRISLLSGRRPLSSTVILGGG